MNERNHWFKRTFDHGSKTLAAADGALSPVLPVPPAAASAHDLEEARLAARAETFAACAALARTWEAKGANAGVLRIQLEQRTDEAWSRLDAHHHTPDPLAEAGHTEAPASASGTGEPSEQAFPTLAPGGAPRPGLTAHAPGPSPSPPDLIVAASSLDHVRAKLIRMVDAGDAPSVEVTAGIVEVLEAVSAVLRGSVLIRQPVSEPQSVRAVDPPTLRVV